MHSQKHEKFDQFDKFVVVIIIAIVKNKRANSKRVALLFALYMLPYYYFISR